jgi:hypothetical protein
VLVVAADTDGEAAALLAIVERQRSAAASAFVWRLRALGRLRSTLDVDRATAIVELLMDPLPYLRLVQQHAWTPGEYAAHLQQIAGATLLGSARTRRRSSST